jgi:iron-sulfur cluster assembly protein
VVEDGQNGHGTPSEERSYMLVLTALAKDAVREMVAAQEAPEGSGLRIAAELTDGEEAALSLELATAPEAGDAVLDEDGARIFLDEAAASLLDDKVLDATEHEDHVHLTVQDQPSEFSSNGRVAG